MNWGNFIVSISAGAAWGLMIIHIVKWFIEEKDKKETLVERVGGIVERTIDIKEKAVDIKNSIKESTNDIARKLDNIEMEITRELDSIDREMSANRRRYEVLASDQRSISNSIYKLENAVIENSEPIRRIKDFVEKNLESEKQYQDDVILQKAFALACRFIGDNFGSPNLGSNDEDGEELLSWQDYFIERVENEQVCRVCGCTENNACLGGCHWVEEDLCSQCVDK